MATTKERIILLLNNKGVTISNFFSSIGVSYSNFKGKQLESSPSADLVAKIKSNFPDVNTDWLLTGEGEMLIKKDANFAQTEKFFEKISTSFEELNKGQLEIVGQNGEVIKINAEIIKQNSELIRQHAEAMEVIKKLSEKLK